MKVEQGRGVGQQIKRNWSMLEVSYFLKEVLLQTLSRKCRHSWLVRRLIKIGKRYFFLLCGKWKATLMSEYEGGGTVGTQMWKAFFSVLIFWYSTISQFEKAQQTLCCHSDPFWIHLIDLQIFASNFYALCAQSIRELSWFCTLFCLRIQCWKLKQGVWV